MSWIQEIEGNEAGGELRRIYVAIEKSRGKVSNIMQVHSLNPGAMRHHLALYVHLMFAHSGLTRGEREAIAVAVSQANGCAYCINHHREALAAVEQNDDVARESRRKAMLVYAEQLTRSPETMREADVKGLRAAGLNDRDILDAALVTAYFNFVNRIALGLGVEFSAEEMHGYRN